MKILVIFSSTDWCKKQIMSASTGVAPRTPYQQSTTTVKPSPESSVTTPERPLSFPIPLISSLQMKQNKEQYRGEKSKRLHSDGSTNQDVIVISNTHGYKNFNSHDNLKACDTNKNEQIGELTKNFIENSMSPLNLSCKDDSFTSKLSGETDSVGVLKEMTSGKRHCLDQTNIRLKRSGHRN